MTVGRPRVYGRRIGTVFRLPPELHERLKEAARERDVSANLLVTRAIDDFLDRLTPVEDLPLTRPSP